MKKTCVFITLYLFVFFLLSCGLRTIPSGTISVRLTDGRQAKIEGFLAYDGNVLVCQDDRLDISSLQAGTYTLVLWGRAPESPEEYNDFLWVGPIELSRQDIISGKTLRPETWEPVEVSVEERGLTEGANESVKCFFARFIDARDTALYGPFPLNRAIAVHAEGIEGVVVQDLSTQTQVTQRIDWTRPDKRYTVDYVEEEISSLTVAFDRREVSPKSLRFTALPTEEGYMVYGGEAYFENETGLFELLFGQWEAYRWEASFYEAGTTYHIRSREPLRLDWSYLLTIDLGGALHLTKVGQPYYTINERIQIGFNDLIRDAYDHTAVSYTHLRAHETVLDLVCRLLLEKKNKYKTKKQKTKTNHKIVLTIRI